MRSLGLSIVEHACHEHHFLHDFFLAKATSPIPRLKAEGKEKVLEDEMGRELFHRVMGKSIGILSKAVEDQGNASFDAIALFLSIQLLYRFQVRASSSFKT